MGELVKNTKQELVVKTVVDLARDEEPRSGFIYIANSGDEIYRLGESFLYNDKYLNFKVDVYDFDKNEWVPDYRYNRRDQHTVTVDTIKQYYTRIVSDFDDVIRKARHVYDTGDVESITPNDELLHDTEVKEDAVTSTRVNQETLLEMTDKLDIVRARMDEITRCVNVIMVQRKQQLEAIKNKMYGIVARYKEQMEKIMRVITVIELYMGIDEELFQITSGEPSKSDELVIRQLVLYMDEEVGEYKLGGLDHTDINKFDEWLTVPEHRDQVIPEDRSIVFFKPRRKPKRYTSNSYENSIMNQWNFETYILIRNGDNLYRVYSEKIWCGKTVFPKRDELHKILEKANNPDNTDHDTAVSDFEYLNYTATKIAAIINGLCHRSNIFPGNQHDMFKMDETGIRVIYDAENTLGDGRESFKDFLKRVNGMVTDGSRIYFTGIERFDGRDFLRDRLVKYYYNDNSMPSQPDIDMYQVIKLDGEQLGFRYMPTYGYTWDRKNKVSFKIWKDDTCFINYDQVSFEEIDAYMKNRLERENYLNMMPLLDGLRKRLHEDLERETDFVRMMMGLENVDEQTVRDAIKWWKLKNKWKRSVWDDDAKACRMIRAKINRDKYNKIVEI